MMQFFLTRGLSQTDDADDDDDSLAKGGTYCQSTVKVCQSLSKSVKVAPFCFGNFGGVLEINMIFLIIVGYSGWSHLLSNAMKHSLTFCAEWPRYLSMIRDLCSFFKNDTYRKFVGRKLKDQVAGSVKMCKSWTASFAKWRYETVDAVFAQLLQYKIILNQMHTLAADFARTYDPAATEAAFQAANDGMLMTFVTVWHTLIVRPLEQARRWGLMCVCHADQYRHGKKTHCVMSGRRLHGARQRIDELLDVLRQNRNDIDLMMCGGAQWLFLDVCAALDGLITWLSMKFKFLWEIPYRLVEADDPIQAQEVINQLHSFEYKDLDPISKFWKDHLLADLTQVAWRTPLYIIHLRKINL